MHDAIQCETAGVPAAVIVTDVFPSLALRTAENLGLPGYQPIVVAHPIFTRDDKWITDQARRVADAVVRQLRDPSAALDPPAG